MSDPRLKKLVQLRRKALAGGGPKRITRQHVQGKQTVFS